MLGASAFGWTYLGEVALDADAVLPETIQDFDSRFAAGLFGWPYMGALPGVFVPPAIVEAEGQGADGSVFVYQGRNFVPITRPKEEKKKKFWPTLPEEFEGFEQAEIIQVPGEDGGQIVSPTKESIPYVPDKAKPGQKVYRPKPQPTPDELVKHEPVKPIEITPGERREFKGVDKKLLLRLAEESIVFGVDPKDSNVRKMMEDIGLVDL